MIYILFFINLLITVLIEGLLIFIFTKKKKFFYYSFLCNILTNPAMNLLLIISVKTLGCEFYYFSLFLLELCVVTIEAIVYQLLCKWNTARAIIISTALNFISCLCGIIINSMF